MKAIRVHQHGGPEVLSYEDAPDPSPAPDQAVVKIDAAGVNFIDIYFRTGLYKTDLPFTNGQEAAGVVTAVGTDVSDLQIGDRVAYAGVAGSYAEYAAVPAARLVKLPDGVATRTAAAVMLQGMTVHYLTHSTFPLKPGHTALVHAAAEEMRTGDEGQPPNSAINTNGPMASMARVVMEGVPHHITQRGSNRQDVSLRDEYVCEETGDEVVLMKNSAGHVIGFEKLYFSVPDPEPLNVSVETTPA